MLDKACQQTGLKLKEAELSSGANEGNAHCIAQNTHTHTHCHGLGKETKEGRAINGLDWSVLGLYRNV